MISVHTFRSRIFAVTGTALLLCSMTWAQAASTARCCGSSKAEAAPALTAADESKTASFAGPKANTGAVVMTKSAEGIKLALTDAFKTPEVPDAHWQVVDLEGKVFQLQRIDVKDKKSNRSIVLPEFVKSVAKVQIWCAFAETNLGEATFEAPKAVKAAEAKTADAETMTHKSGTFAGPKANKGFVTHSRTGGKSVLTLSDDFVVPDTPDPHWSVIDSKGRTYLLERLPVKGDKVNRQITLPDYVADVATVRIWCAFAEVNLGEAKFEHPVM